MIGKNDNNGVGYGAGMRCDKVLFTNEAYSNFAKDPAVAAFSGRYFLYHSIRYPDGRFGIGIAESSDLEHWTIVGEIPIKESYEQNGIAAPGSIVLGDQLHLFYQTYGNGRCDAICHAVSSDGIHFTRNPENPVFRPGTDWCSGRAIDADVCVFNGKLHLYFATRDYEMKIQQIGGAWASLDTGFGKKSWHTLADHPLLVPELLWEGECVEAPATIVRNGKVYLFYGGSYNCTPQQIGCAVSEDGVTFRRLSDEPFLTCGAAGTWNQCESGHPYIFEDQGRIYLFYQGSADKGKTWYLSKMEICFADENEGIMFVN